MLKAVFVIVAAMLALACLGLAEDATPPVGTQNRITPEDDGTILLNELGNDMLMFSDIDLQGSRLSESGYSKENRTIGYLLFDLSALMPVADQNLVMLKIYADNSRDLNDDLIIVSGRVLAIADGISPSGFLLLPKHNSQEIAGPGFVLFNLTEEVKTLQEHEQKTIGIFFAGEDQTIGTMESGKPAEMIVL